jgi:uncharacterized protein (DUF58 family)
MLLKAKFVVEGTVAGMHTSRFKGQSLEFAQHREYSSGDELKHIDWKIYGKSDRYFIKQYEEETNLKAYILLDASGSMGYKSDGISKLEYASYIVAALSYLMIRQGDAVGLAVYDGSIRRNIPPRSGPGHLSVILEELSGIEPGGDTDISKILMDFSKYLKKRGLIIIISDLFDDQEGVIRAVKNYRYAKHDVIVFHLLDKHEEKLDISGNFLFRDMETGKNIITEPEIIRQEYGKLVAGFIDKYKTELHKADIEYSYLNTSTPLDWALTRYLSGRRR